MANLEKRQKLDWEVPTAFRDKLVCKKCDILPRPGTEVMRCISCKNILCGKCCGTKCPLCRHVSKNPRFSTFTKELELMEVLSGLKTHPCTNVKNGCLEEIPAKLDKLTAHEQNCVFQKVSCPDCEGDVIFKDVGQHLKQHVNGSISVNSNAKRFAFDSKKFKKSSKILGIYHLQADLINDRKYYKKDYGFGYAISWNEKSYWNITSDMDKGKCTILSFAMLEKDVQNLHNTSDWKMREKVLKGRGKFQILGDWRGKMLRVKGR